MPGKEEGGSLILLLGFGAQKLAGGNSVLVNLTLLHPNEHAGTEVEMRRMRRPEQASEGELPALHCGSPRICSYARQRPRICPYRRHYGSQRPSEDGNRWNQLLCVHASRGAWTLGPEA